MNMYIYIYIYVRPRITGTAPQTQTVCCTNAGVEGSDVSVRSSGLVAWQRAGSSNNQQLKNAKRTSDCRIFRPGPFPLGGDSHTVFVNRDKQFHMATYIFETKMISRVLQVFHNALFLRWDYFAVFWDYNAS